MPTTSSVEEAIYKASLFYEEDTKLTFENFVKSVDILLSAVPNYKPSEEQLRVLYTRAKKLLVDSSAGTGKTTTLLIKQLIEVYILKYTPSEILTITYTDASAKDLYNKFYRLVSNLRVGELLEYSTIHSFCLKFLKVFSKTPIINVLTENSSVLVNKVDIVEDEDGSYYYDEYEVSMDLKQVLQEVYEILAIPEEDLKNPFFSDIYTHISVLNERLIDTEEDFNNYLVVSNLPEIDYKLFKSILKTYNSVKESYNLIDYNDMLYKTREILSNINDYLDEEGTPRRIIQDLFFRYKSIYVDEVQDISPLQAEILDLLLKVNPQAKYTVIGDGDQSIYNFRGADVKYILDFQQIYPESECIYLTRNRRSTQEIIDLGNVIIKNNEDRRDKVARGVPGVTKTNPNGLMLVTLPKYTNSYITGNYVYNYIQALPQPATSAILYREHKQLASLITDLIINRIPFNTKLSSSNPLIVFNHSLVHHFQTTINLLKYPYERILMQKFLTVFSKIKKAEINPIIDKSNGKLLKTLLSLGYLKPSGSNYLVKMSELVKSNAPVSDVYNEYKNFLDSIEYRINSNVDRYLNSFEIPVKDLDWKLNEDMNWYIQFSKLGINLVSSHSSKGLEYENVLILPISDDTTPKQTILENLSDKGRKEYIEEERRLLYVTITRAISSLTILVEENSYFGDELVKAFKKLDYNIL